MSDSDEAFQSADEGEGARSATSPADKSKQNKPQAKGDSSKTQKSSPQKNQEPAKKGKNKQRKGKGKQKGKEGSKDEKTNKEDVPVVKQDDIDNTDVASSDKEKQEALKTSSDKDDKPEEVTTPTGKEENQDSLETPGDKEKQPETVESPIDKSETPDTKETSGGDEKDEITVEKSSEEPVGAQQESSEEGGRGSAGKDAEKETTPTRKMERRKQEEKEESKPVSDDREKVLDKLSSVADNKGSGWGGGWGGWGDWGTQILATATTSVSTFTDQVDDEADDESKDGAGWGDWGTKILAKASTSVSTFTDQVDQGFSTLVETVESAIGVPDPEDLAQERTTVMDAKEPEPEPSEDEAKKKEQGPTDAGKDDEVGEKPEEQGKESSQAEKEENAGGGGWGWSAWGLGNLTKSVQSTSLNLVSGGLDVLENVGKKTFDVLAQSDPGLHQTKAILHNNGEKLNLSQMLREAKAKTESLAELNKEEAEAQKAKFGYLFEEFQGFAHLEALEMLSNNCERKVQNLLASMSGEQLDEIKPHLLAIKGVFSEEIEEEDEEDDDKDHFFEELITDETAKLDIGLPPVKVLAAQRKAREWVIDCKEEQEKGVKMDAKEIHQMAIQSIAEMTAKAIEHFHKTGELSLMQKESKEFEIKAMAVTQMTKIFCTEVGIQSNRFVDCLNTAADDMENPDSVNPMITTVFLEATNSSTYMQDAFQLLLPVLQLAVMQTSAQTST